MKIRNRQEGVTLITVVITIVVVIIIAAIGYTASNTGLEEAVSTKFKQEIAEVKKGVDTQKIINSKKGLDEATLNSSFKKVNVSNPPKNFVSFDTEKSTAYLIDLDVIDYTKIKTGQKYKDLQEGDTVTFNEDDVYIYDKKGTVYYVKGISIDGNENVYTIDSREKEGPDVTAENTEGGIISITVIPIKGGEITSVTVDGQMATKESEGVYKFEVVKNGNYTVIATEEGNGATRTTAIVNKLDETDIEGESSKAPTKAIIKINTGEAYTTRQLATLVIDTDAEIMCIKQIKSEETPAAPSSGDATWRRSADTAALYLSEGLNVVHAWFKNKKNDTVLYQKTSIILDTTPPTRTKPDVVVDGYNFEITAKQIDPAVGSGLKKIEIGYKESTASEYKWFEVEDILNPKITIKNNKPNANYNIKSRAEDNVGHITESVEHSTGKLNDIPNGIVIEYSPTTGWTTLSTVVITYPEKAMNDDFERWYRFAEGEWKEATGRVEKLYIEDNMKIDAVVVKKTDTETLFGEIKSLTIENIDVIEPRVENIKLNLSNVPTNFDFRGTATIKDDESGIFAYAIVNSENNPEKWTPLNETLKEKEITFGVKVDTTNYIWIRDIAGNTSKTYVKVEAKKFDDSNIKIELTKDNYEYTGQEIQAEILVKDEDENVTLKKDVHYTITYENNINVGTATATITGKKAYSGTKKINFTIVAVKPTITLENTSYTYDRNNKSIKSATVTGTPNGTTPTGVITYTYYTSEKVDDPNNRTTSANGAASVGGAPSKVGTYYVVAEIAAHGNYLAATSNTAILTIQPCAVTVTFNANGGSVGTNTKTVYYDETYGDLPTATRTGYTFAGWYTSSTGGTKVTNTSTVTNSNAHTLYAHWTANQYTVTLNANGGSVSTSTITVTYDSTYGTLPNPSRTNYNFSGWYTATSGGTQVKSSTVVKITANQTLYAQWKIKNAAPVISLNQLSSKDTTVFNIRANATDAENDKLTYKLYVSSLENSNYVIKVTSSNVEPNTYVRLTANGLNEFQEYWWYIEVSDKYNTVQSEKQKLKTYCSGGGTCYADTCTQNRSTCTYCDGDYQITCSNSSCVETGSGFIPSHCPKCGGGSQQKRETYGCSSCGHFGYILVTWGCSCGYSEKEGSLSVPHSAGSCTHCDSGYVYSGKCSRHNLSDKHYYCNKHSYTGTNSSHTYTCSHGITGKHDS